MRKKQYLTMMVGVFVTITCLGISSSWAADYPTKPITLLNGYPAGSTSDTVVRALASALEPLLGQPVVISNRPGATGTIMMALLKNSKPDGYTIAITPASLAVTPYFQKVEYDILRDFTYLVALYSFAPPLTVRSDSRWKTAQDFIKDARQNPGQLKIGTAAIQSSSAILGRALGHLAGVNWTLVPFDGDGEVVTAILGSHVHAGINNGSQVPHVKAGTLRMLAFFTSTRMKDFSGVPTFKELGYDLVTDTLSGIAGPKGLPAPIVQRLTNALVKARESDVFTAVENKLYLLPEKEVGKEFERRLIEINKSLDKYLKIK